MGQIGRLLEDLPRTRDCFGFVHNDPHIFNLLADGDAITLLDFDVANHHWFVSDIAIACQSVLFSISGGMERPVSDRRSCWHFSLASWKATSGSTIWRRNGWIDSTCLSSTGASFCSLLCGAGFSRSRRRCIPGNR